MASLPWSTIKFYGIDEASPAWQRFDSFLGARLDHMEPVLARGDWLAGSFSVADIMMADVLRLIDRFDRLSG